jgi:hypothetical protein
LLTETGHVRALRKLIPFYGMEYMTGLSLDGQVVIPPSTL